MLQIKPKSNKKIVLTGGHGATAALATIEEIERCEKDWTLYWLGPAAAEKFLREQKVEIVKLIVGKAQRAGSILDKFSAYIKIPIGFIHAFIEVLKINPDLVLSFGGYAGLPVVCSAWLTGTPVVLHEQIVGVGLANKLSAPFVRKIAVARKESLDFFPREKSSLIGNPQLSAFFQVKKKEAPSDPPVVLITGGSSGSRLINDTIDKILEILLEKYIVIHQTGENNEGYFRERKEKLKDVWAERYEVEGYVHPNKMASYFEKSDIVVCRAGANTVSDIAAAKRPAIIIPIPWTIGDEQGGNAQKALKTGLVTILDEGHLTPRSLFEEINKVREKWKEIIKSADTKEYDLDKLAAQRLVEIMEGTLK